MLQELSYIKIPSSTRAGKLSRTLILLLINLLITGNLDTYIISIEALLLYFKLWPYDTLFSTQVGKPI